MTHQRASEKGSALPLGNIVLATLAAVALVGVVWYFGGPRGTETGEKTIATSQKEGSNERVYVDAGSAPSLGRRDAKVAIVIKNVFVVFASVPICAMLLQIILGGFGVADRL